MEFSHGQMEEAILVNGKMASNTVMEYTKEAKEKRKKDIGKREEEYDG